VRVEKIVIEMME